MTKKILLVEDERDLRNFLTEELTDAGFRVTAVKDGAQAVITAVDESFDLALTDMMMPGLDGIQTIRVLKKLAPAMPIIGLTGYVGQGYMSQAASYGVTCLSKPIVMADLLKEINETMPVKA